MQLASGKPNSFLLESVEGAEIRGRFSVIGMAPDLIWRYRGNLAEINHNPSESSDFEAVDGDPLTAIRALMAESAMDDTGDLPPMAAGLFGYLGYDMIWQIETIPDENTPAIDKTKGAVRQVAAAHTPS